ncbi:probable zinc transporter ZupT [Aeropyrum pernix K1]|uniref:Probable zinc transporter ZupT n=1 Tax=Aeropyrum pernix (strain ATCC 700893 / DSM 11879 / JCM 9820 / NBRC 100138 / K1) TaxID=272557 RepID=Q9YBA6_AERPE|nr:ZIP family metal transporter [Aeropyrum pernix]BAA80692.1 probable zinc transporter ZupT [Aeropyrum pernix K1]
MSPVLEVIAGLISGIAGGNPIKAAFLLSLYAFAMTSLGGFLVLAARTHGGRLDVLLDVGMGFSSGIMIVASFTSLLLPALEISGPGIVIISFIVGAIAVYIINEILPHEHLIKGYEGPPSFRRKVKAAWLVATAIIIHNLPEGMSIGAAASYAISEGLAVALAIGTQDFPEGLAVSLPVFAASGSLYLALLVAMLSGFSEVVAATIVAALIGYSPGLLASALAFAAGAMVFVVSYEALPESHRSGNEKLATVGFFAGFIIMLYLDTALG